MFTTARPLPIVTFMAVLAGCQSAGSMDQQGDVHRQSALQREDPTDDRGNLTDGQSAEIESVMTSAAAHAEEGRLDEAEKLYTDALAAQEQSLGAEHPATIAIRAALAGLYTEQGRFEEAEPHLLDVVSVRRRDLGDEHPHTLDAMQTLALVHEQLGRHEKAAALTRKVNRIQQRLSMAGQPE